MHLNKRIDQYIYLHFTMHRIKKSAIQPSLQPWQHEQQQPTTPNINMNPTEITIQQAFNPEFKHFTHNDQQFLYSRKNSRVRVKDHNSIQEGRCSKQSRRSGTIDFVKKNQQNLHLYNFNNHYSALLNQDLQKFIPLNANNKAENNNFIRRPSINTTYIGYYDQQPFFVDTSKSRVKKQQNKSWSIDCKRPKTSDFTTNSRQNRQNPKAELSKIQYCQQTTHICDRSTLAVSGHHLQKVLKIKQKLRQKLKRNSHKKDVQRGLHINNTMKIEQQKNESRIQNNRSFMQSKTLSQSRKSSMKSIEQKQKKRIDKWKQYMKLQQERKQKQKQQKIKQKQKQNYYNNRRNIKNQMFFAVLGGSIYK